MSAPGPQIFCVKCRKKVTPLELTSGPIRWQCASGERTREAWHAKCPDCGVRVKQFKKGEMRAATAPPVGDLNASAPIPQ